MKLVKVYTKFIISLFFLAAPVQAVTLTEDADRIQNALDHICGDSWCEGAFDFHFQKVLLKPGKNVTQIFFRMSQEYPVKLDSNKGSLFKAQINRRFYDVSCTIPGYASFDSMMQSELFLRSEVYTALTACIDDLEQRLMQVTKPL